MEIMSLQNFAFTGHEYLQHAGLDGRTKTICTSTSTFYLRNLQLLDAVALECSDGLCIKL